MQYVIGKSGDGNICKSSRRTKLGEIEMILEKAVWSQIGKRGTT